MPSKARSILLVEDEADTLELLSSVLTRKFPKVALYTAGDGGKGLQLYLEHRPVIVITDIVMPGMTGLQMADEIRETDPEVKIIVLSAGTGKTNREHAAGKGLTIDHYILKPIDFRTLFAAVEECLAEIMPGD
jgi:YesN/AraC family two-component response regulator